MIAVEALTKRYGTKLAVDQLSFIAQPGRVTALLGPNGAGKSTTLRALLGLTKPTSGSATFDGQTYPALAHPTRSAGAVLELHSFHPWRSARAHLRALAVAGGIPRNRVESVLRYVDLGTAADRRVGEYSFGMRQRLSLAVALLGDPQALVLDEPQNGLDPHGTRWLRELVRTLANEGRTVLISSHLLTEMSEVADDVVIVTGGRLVREAPLAGVLRETRAGVKVVTPDADRFTTLLTSRGLTADHLDHGDMLVRGGQAAAVGALAAQHGVTLHELTPNQRRLEDVFLELTGEPETR